MKKLVQGFSVTILAATLLFLMLGVGMSTNWSTFIMDAFKFLIAMLWFAAMIYGITTIFVWGDKRGTSNDE